MKNILANRENTEQAASGPAAPEHVTPSPATPGLRSSVAPFANHRNRIIAALTAASVLSAAPAFADDEAKKVEPPKIAKIQKVNQNDKAQTPPNKPPEQGQKPAKKPIETHHHTFKVGGVLSLEANPSAGTEVIYSYTPWTDPSKKIHFVLTPIDFMVSQHHTHINLGHAEGHALKTDPKYFAGSMVGFSFLPHKNIELEAAIGGGAAILPQYEIMNNELKSRSPLVSPLFKFDAQVDFISKYIGGYIGWSPEVILDSPHAVTKKGAERKLHFSNLLAFGLRKDF